MIPTSDNRRTAWRQKGTRFGPSRIGPDRQLSARALSLLRDLLRRPTERFRSALPSTSYKFNPARSCRLRVC